VALSLASRAVTGAYRDELMAIRNATTASAARLWAGVDPTDIDASLVAPLAAIDALLSAAQTRAVVLADLYLQTYMTVELGQVVEPYGLDPSVYAGHTRDGRRTSDVLALASVSMKLAMAAGVSLAAVSAAGLARTARTVRTESVDAARTAQQTAMNGDDRIDGSQRATSGEPCAACLAAAGQHIADGEEAWPIHGACQCTAEPVTAGHRSLFGPATGAALVAAMGAATAARVYGEPTAEYVEAGGDLQALVVVEPSHQWGDVLFAAPASSIPTLTD